MSYHYEPRTIEDQQLSPLMASHGVGCRRNYDSVFQGISQSVELMNASNFHLSLIGMGSIGVPSNLSSRIAMHAQLPYRVRSARNLDCILTYKCS